MPVSDSLEAIAMRQEAKRFESVCPNIQSLYDLLEEIDNVPLKRKMRELVNRIEGKLGQLTKWIFRGINRSKSKRYSRFELARTKAFYSWFSPQNRSVVFLSKI